MTDNIILLDTSLRDGSHLNGGRFGKKMIADTVCALCKAGVDYVELGFLTTEQYDADISLFQNVNQAKSVLPNDIGRTRFALMDYRFDINKIDDYDGGPIDLIRITNHVYDFEEGVVNCLRAKEKGYKTSFNLINFYGAYTEEEKIENFKRINEIHPSAISMADTYGLMDIKDMKYIYDLADAYLDKDIILGIHLHENRGISYAMAQEFLRMKEIENDRTVLIDGTIYGIGEVPGNLRLEQMIEFLNKYHGSDYDIEPIYKVIDDYFAELKNERNWEYALPYAVSAKYGINRKYAQFLIEQGDVGVYDMNLIMKGVHGQDKPSYNKILIRELYEKYKNGEHY